MQNLQGLVVTDFDEKSHVAIGKIEIDTTGWNNFQELPDVKSCRINCSLINEVMLFSAASFTITCLNTDDRYSWHEEGATYYNWLREGRKIRIYIGINYSDSNYHWKWITGRIDVPKFTQEAGKEICTLNGRCLMRMLIENRMKQVYWGAQKFFSTSDSQDEYPMPSDCRGVHRAFLDSKSPYNGTNFKEITKNSGWSYDWTTNIFLLLRSIIPYYDGTNNLIVYYFRPQVAEQVIADILIEAGFLSEYERVGWLANSDYVTPTGKIISRVWFNKGTTCLEALRLVAEAVRYRFYPDHDGNPIFKPPPVGSESVKLVSIDNITINNRNELVDEIRNHIIVKGEERKKLVKLPTTTTHPPSIDSETETVILYGVVDSVGKGNITRRGFQWGTDLAVDGGWYTGAGGIGQFEHQLTPSELANFLNIEKWYRAYVKNSQGMFFGKWVYIEVAF